MVIAKLAFALVQVGSHLWINPTQLQGIMPVVDSNITCKTYILVANDNGHWCSDWDIDKVREALSPAAVSKALEGK